MDYTYSKSTLDKEYKLTPWDILDLPHDASKRQIKSRYRQLSLVYHPDKNKNTIASSELFSKITEAYNYLMKLQEENDCPDDEIEYVENDDTMIERKFNYCEDDSKDYNKQFNEFFEKNTKIDHGIGFSEFNHKSEKEPFDIEKVTYKPPKSDYSESIKIHNSESNSVINKDSLSGSSLGEAFKTQWIGEDQIKDEPITSEEIMNEIKKKTDELKDIKYETEENGVKRRFLELKEQCVLMYKKYISYE